MIKITVTSTWIARTVPRIGTDAFTIVMALTTYLRPWNNDTESWPHADSLRKKCKVEKAGKLVPMPRPRFYAGVGRAMDEGIIERRQENTAGQWGKMIYRITTKHINLIVEPTLYQAGFKTRVPKFRTTENRHTESNTITIQDSNSITLDIQIKNKEQGFARFWDMYNMKKQGSRKECWAWWCRATEETTDHVLAVTPQYIKETTTSRHQDPGDEFKPMRKYPERYLAKEIYKNYENPGKKVIPEQVQRKYQQYLTEYLPDELTWSQEPPLKAYELLDWVELKLSMPKEEKGYIFESAHKAWARRQQNGTLAGSLTFYEFLVNRAKSHEKILANE